MSDDNGLVEDAGDDILDLDLDDEEPLPAVTAAPPPSGRDVLVIDAANLTVAPQSTPTKSAGKSPAPSALDFPSAETMPGEGGKSGEKSYGKPRGVTAADVFGVLNNIMAGALGGFIGWVFTNPYIHDPKVGELPVTQLLAVVLGGMGLYFGCVGGMIGMMLGLVEGVTSRVWEKAGRAAVVGLAVGAGGGFVGGVIGQAFYGALSGGEALRQGNLTGAQVAVRGFGWALVGLFVGLGMGVYSRSQRRMVNGAIGGFIGGLGGGLLFDPLASLLIAMAHLTGGTIGGGFSRLVALVVLGMACGMAIGVIEAARKEAWLRVVEGPFSGKQFILYRSPTMIGSSPKCDITVLDKSVAPQHAAITQQGGHHAIADLESGAGTRVNGQAIRTRVLRSGDRITLGQTTFLYADRQVS
jgi:hypothetical protein